MAVRQTADPATETRPPADPGPGAALSGRQVAARTAAWAVGVAALAWFVVARIGRYGFNPSDQGFVLALSRRVLEGQIPHVDVVSPRPLGSAYLHTVDLLLPGPLFVVSGFLAMVQVIVATIACAALVSRVSPLRWGPLRILLVGAAALVSIHTFTLMAWHTVDGIFLTAVGWWLLDDGLRSGSAWRRRTGLLLLGFAVMCKQSFMFAVPAGVALLVLHPAEDRRANLRSPRWWRRTVVDLLFLGAVPLAYVAVVTAGGGFTPMVEQLTGGVGEWGRNLYQFWWNGYFVAPGARRDIVLVAGCVLVAAALWLVRGRLGGAAVWLRALPLAAAAVVTTAAVVRTDLAYPATWSIEFLWILAAVVVLDAVVGRHVPWPSLLVLLLAYMTSLSWGYNLPGLVAGTLVLTTFELLVRALPELDLGGWRRWVLQPLVGVVALVGTGALLVAEHDRAPAIDQPVAELTADLGDSSADLRYMRTNPVTARYVAQLRDCTERYPAAQVAVLPDNPFAYWAFDLDNPFPADWPLPMELVADGPERMLDTVIRLNRDGDYLVLFETLGWEQLRDAEPIPSSVPVDAPHISLSQLDLDIRDRLDGQRISCGSFVGVWSPAG